LSNALGVPVVPFVAKQRRGIHELAQAVCAVVEEKQTARCRPVEIAMASDSLRRQSRLIKRYAFIERIIDEAVEESRTQRSHSVSERIGLPSLRKLFGTTLLTAPSSFQFAGKPMRMSLITRNFQAGLTDSENRLNELRSSDCKNVLDGILAEVMV